VHRYHAQEGSLEENSMHMQKLPKKYEVYKNGKIIADITISYKYTRRRPEVNPLIPCEIEELGIDLFRVIYTEEGRGFGKRIRRALEELVKNEEDLESSTANTDK